MVPSHLWASVTIATILAVALNQHHFVNSFTSPLHVPSSLTTREHQRATSFQQHQHAFLNLGDSHHSLSAERNSNRRNIPSCLNMAKNSNAKMSQSWLPRKINLDDDIFAVQTERALLEEKSIEFLASLIQNSLNNAGTTKKDESESSSSSSSVVVGKRKKKKFIRAYQLAKGRFLDLACTIEGEHALEDLFATDLAIQQEDEDVIRGAIIALQSLLIMGTQVGVKGTPQQQKKNIAHLFRGYNEIKSQNNGSNKNNGKDGDDVWNADSIRKLKHEVNQVAGTQVMAKLQRKRTAQSVFDLLVELGVWGKHEDVVLLRSGFPTRFTDDEEEAAKEAIENLRDPDKILGLRKDLRRLKAYTIDSASASEIDDGLSVEVLTNEDGSVRQRFWIHIADADHWAPRDSAVFGAARRRASSIYLPTGTVPMFPQSITGMMSLTADRDAYALSLGVELLPDGRIDTSSIVITPSLIRITYRLTYDDVDDMLEEGVGYSEEWQLGALLAAATKRRAHRVSKGSAEGFVPNPIPQASVKIVPDDDAPDGVAVSINLEVSHNAGNNQTASAEVPASDTANDHAPPVSPANLLVTEMMILSGEAFGKMKFNFENEEKQNINGEHLKLSNTLKLPYRSQKEPDLRSRPEEVSVMQNLKKTRTGGGYCHAWYSRRFFKPVRVEESMESHAGMGLDCYVQWTSPIRRFGDLQAHAAVKRYLRRKMVNKLIREGSVIPPELRYGDLGCSVPRVVQHTEDDTKIKYELVEGDEEEEDEINYRDGQALITATRPVMRQSQQYWMFEYIQRLVSSSDEEVDFECVVLGCIDYERYRYAIYVHRLGLEHNYLSETGALKPGQTLWLKVSSTNPRMGLLTFTLSSRGGGIAARSHSAPAA